MTKHKDDFKVPESAFQVGKITLPGDYIPPEKAKEFFERIKQLEAQENDAALQRLIDSGIVTATDSAISWRDGHLEHVARLYVADPVLAWRDYADDLTVALAADGSAFAAAVEAARGTAE